MLGSSSTTRTRSAGSPSRAGRLISVSVAHASVPSLSECWEVPVSQPGLVVEHAGVDPAQALAQVRLAEISGGHGGLELRLGGVARRALDGPQRDAAVPGDLADGGPRL